MLTTDGVATRLTEARASFSETTKGVETALGKDEVDGGSTGCARATTDTVQPTTTMQIAYAINLCQQSLQLDSRATASDVEFREVLKLPAD